VDFVVFGVCKLVCKSASVCTYPGVRARLCVCVCVCVLHVCFHEHILCVGVDYRVFVVPGRCDDSKHVCFFCVCACVYVCVCV
jgi:hypothetical protein